MQGSSCVKHDECYYKSQKKHFLILHICVKSYKKCKQINAHNT